MNTRLDQIASSGHNGNVILFGIGNSGRSDDGLGWAFLEGIGDEGWFRGQKEYRYQLQVEDAALISRADEVIFVDSYRGDLPGGFRWQPCPPSACFEFTTHLLSPGSVMHLCRDLFGKTPRAHCLQIQGDAWDLHTGLSARAEQRLGAALSFFRDQQGSGAPMAATDSAQAFL
jgi:hydrogenase maturation protease